MIAKVRIAPIDRYCKFEFEKMARFPEVDYQLAEGFSVLIDTASMKLSELPDCSGRVWLVLPESLEALYERTGGECNDITWFCEHMLEMD